MDSTNGSNSSNDGNMSSEMSVSAGTKRSASIFTEIAGNNGPEDKRPRIHEPCEDARGALEENHGDDTTTMAPYDPSKEEYPRLAFYHPGFAQAEKHIQEACDIVIQTFHSLTAEGYANAQLANICNEYCLESCRIPSRYYPPIKAVAALGPAGSGKSSAINSIMNAKKAAFEHDGDDRGTFVVHEYRSHAVHQTSKYLVQVPYHSRNDIIRDMTRAQLTIMSYLFARDENIDDDKFSDNSSDKEEHALEQKYKTALDLFSDIFCNHEEFQTPKDVAEWFEERADHEKHTILAELTGYLDEFLKSRDCENEMETFEPDSEDGPSQICRQVSRPSQASSKRAKKPSPWGIIRKVVIHQDVPLLRQGLVLADTPGINDQNLTVVDNTRRYLRVAGTVLIFLSYRRIHQNSPLDQLLRECISLGKMHDTTLVVTMIDNMAAITEEQKEDELDMQELRLIETAEHTLEDLESEIKYVEKAKRGARGTDNNLYAKLDMKLEDLELEKCQAIVAVKQATITIRCAQLKNKLKTKLKEIDGSKHAPELPVVFISNTEYQKHVSGYEMRCPPQLDLIATGIPRLRQFLHSIPTRGKLQNLKGLAENRLPNILSGINGVLTKTSLERKAEVRQTILAVMKGYEEPVNELKRDIQEAFQIHIVDFIAKAEPHWIEQALEMIKTWKGTYKAISFRGIYTRDGKWEGHKFYGDIDWNKDVHDIFSVPLMKTFDNLDDAVDRIQKNFNFAVEELFDDLKRNVENSKDAQGQNLAPFFQHNRLAKEHVKSRIADKFDGLRQVVARLRHAATICTGNSYATSLMEATYKQCLLCRDKSIFEESGSTSTSGRRPCKSQKPSMHASRVQILVNRMQGAGSARSLFQDIGECARCELAACVKEWGVQSNAIVATGFDTIMADFETRFQDPEVKEEENPEATKALLGAVVQALNVLQGPVKQCLQECELYESGRG